MKRRSWILGLTLVVTLGAVWWAAGLEEDAPEPSRQGSSAKPRNPGKKAPRTDAATQAALLARLKKAHAAREALPELAQNPFAATSFAPPPPKVEAPKPVAPPLRYKFMGRLNEGGRLAVFLADGNFMLIAREGEKLGSQYRVVSITERRMQIEYLPLQTLQTLNF